MTDSLNPNHDEPAEGPRDSAYSASSGAETGTGDTNGSGDTGSTGGKANDVFDQIRVAVDDLAVKAGPTVREFSAKAAELVAVAADKAAPIAHKAGEATAEASSKLAVRSRGWAAEVREHVGGTSGTTDSASSPGSTSGSTSTATADPIETAREVAEDNPPL